MRTFAGIYLGPVGNIQGTKKVFDLKTGVVKKVRTIRVFPMPDNVIKVVDAWGKRYQKEKRKNLLTFRDRNKQAFSWENEELDDHGIPPVAASVENQLSRSQSGPALMPGIALESDNDLDDGDDAVEDDTPNEQDELAASQSNSMVVNLLNDETPGVSSNNGSGHDDVADTVVGPQECDLKRVSHYLIYLLVLTLRLMKIGSSLILMR